MDFGPLKNHINIEVLSNTDPDPMNNHNATKPEFKVGPPAARHRNGVSLEGRRCPVNIDILIHPSLRN